MHKPCLNGQHKTAWGRSKEPLLGCRAVVEDGAETTEAEEDDLPRENEVEQLEEASKT